MFAIKAPVTVSVVASAQAQKCEKKATWVFARISSSLDFELYCLFFLRFVGDERWWNFGRYPRKFLSPKKERVRVRVVSKRANSTYRQRYIHLHPPNVSLQSRVAVRVVRKPARIRDIRDENLFFLSPAFCLKVSGFCPKDTQKWSEILLLRKQRKTAYALFAQYQRDCSIFFSH